MSQRLERTIEQFVAERVQRECILMPSGRIAVYCALRTFLSRGDALLMSPNNDDVILFIVLAAGLRPVAAPISPLDGNIDVDAVTHDTWRQVKGVLTTNLYGLPDRVEALRDKCAEHGIPLIEDAAHAIQTEVNGRPIGTFGTAAAFSLSKHVDAYQGGILAVADAGARAGLIRMRDQLVIARSARRRFADAAKPPIRALLETVGVLGALRRRRESATQANPDRTTGHRMELRATELAAAVATGPGLDPFESWTRVDKHAYRVNFSDRDLNFILERLRGMPADRERRIAMVERIRKELAWLIAPGARDGPAVPLFRIPLLVADRESIRIELARQRVWLHYIYDPPLDDYAGPEYVTPSTAPLGARWWARHTLPINPLTADQAIATLRGAARAPLFG